MAQSQDKRPGTLRTLGIAYLVWTCVSALAVIVILLFTTLAYCGVYPVKGELSQTVTVLGVSVSVWVLLALSWLFVVMGSLAALGFGASCLACEKRPSTLRPAIILGRVAFVLALIDLLFCVVQADGVSFVCSLISLVLTGALALEVRKVPDAGEALFFGRPLSADEFGVKQAVGFASGGFGFYPLKRLRTVTDVTRRFYPSWDETAYRRYLALFALDENKRVKELSEGMKVKYALALALSHRARLLVLDEPTSGLDPVSRDELLEIFLQLAQDEGISILFSTHITSDLEKCADHIVYLRRGEVAADADADALHARYRTAALTAAQRDAAPEGLLLGCKREREGFSALLRAEDAPRLGADTAPASLEDIMVHLEKEDGGL